MISGSQPAEDISVEASEPDAVPVAVVERIAAAKECGVEEIPPLYRSVDPDALAGLVAGGTGGLRVSFSHADCRVVVDGEGRVGAAR
ncbi:HalOD1 output domain-containing protein [Halosimplex halophilum]|uniref:HalOD1 output domain-containing protein n=1 Tax=Halosimplex halophilum TaxID=2559572 RepID=UPI0014356693|nr:HalOD1 output domain-containing protein [Halosimplex halophilum]